MKQFYNFIEALKATKPGRVVRAHQQYEVTLSSYGDKCWSKVVTVYYVDENDLEGE